MLFIEKNKVNTLHVTLTELTTISSPFYLLKLKNKNNAKEKVLRAGNDLGDARYNIFRIAEVDSDNENLENSMVNLDRGQYDYTFYETLEATGTSLSNASVSVVEFGLLEVSGSGSTKVTYNSTVNKKTFK